MRRRNDVPAAKWHSDYVNNLSSFRVLVADDSALWRELLVRSLTEAGAKVIGVATDGVDLIDQADRLRPDVIVLDIGLPHLSSLEAADFVREVLLPNVAFVFVGRSIDTSFIAATLTEFGGSYVCKTRSGSDVAKQIMRSLDELCVAV